MTSDQNTSKITEAIYRAIDEVNETLPDDKKIAKSLETNLLGEDGAIDSLGLTMFIISVEQKLDEVLGVTVSLVDGTALSEENSPFRTVQSLTDHIVRLSEGDS